MSSISCRNLVKKYADLQVVHGFDLEIADHEFVVFLGPSGCGKSTIMRMLAGLEEITEGELHIGGVDMTDAEPGERGVAMVFQNYALYPHMNVYKNIAFGLRRSGLSKVQIENKVRDVVKMLALEDYLERKPAQLSGGQQQRVAIARAIVKTPDVFLFDEPLSNLDAKLRHQLRVEIAKLHQQLKTTTVFVTHDQVEAMTLADRIVLMNAGNIEQVGTPKQLYTQPSTLFVADFIGSPAMNLFAGELQGMRLVSPIASFDISDQNLDFSMVSNVTFGIRPQHLSLQKKHRKDVELKGVVSFVEFLGSEVMLTIEANGCEIRLLASEGEVLQRGVEVTVYLQLNRLHLFDTNTGLRLN
ncbi:MAG: sn-glycerol-3-phosphate ABC transporter ATP-binding protein UgpC [Oceanospirillaceae bacterium]|nr:sn-glycerol-3-phosphate ABC transporter ATP-binding protein UgpC [Oceanospirillaceae bacterium]